MATAVLVLADGFEEVEAVTPLDFLRRAGVTVIVAGLSSLQVTSARGLQVKCETLLSEVPRLWDALILPGGMPGAKRLAESPLVKDSLDDGLKRGAWVGAICAAPGLVLDQQGYLEGRRWTGYPGTVEPSKSSHFVEVSTVVDGPFVTSRGVATAPSFALKLISLLVGQEKSDQVARAVLLG